MLIGIEATRANRFKKTGVEWYAHHLIQALKRLPASQDHSWLLYGNESLAHGLQTGPSNWHEARLSWLPKYLWTQLRLSVEMVRHPPDALFVPAHVLPRVIPKRTVVTIHDIGFHRHPELYPDRQRRYHEWTTRDIVKRAARILTVSHFSKNELIEHYGADPERVIVTYPGIDHERYRPVASESPSPYLIYVGRLEEKKNVGVLVKAFYEYKRLRGEDDPLSLVLVGMPGAGYEKIERLIEDGPCPESVKIAGYVSEQEKIALISGASALVHPSWYEGFGFTPLEAMACGAPVICSKAGSLMEVVGVENALWFDPTDAYSLIEAIEALTEHPSLRDDLRRRGLERVKRYDWRRTAEETFEALTKW